MSDRARRALDAAVRLNPAGAGQLFAILRTAPAAVKRKPSDKFGPLGMMVRDAGDAIESSPLARTWVRPRIPETLRREAGAFRREWLAERFTKTELANAIEACLSQAGERVPGVTGSCHVIGPRGGKAAP